jgi:hypothetical protein
MNRADNDSLLSLNFLMPPSDETFKSVTVRLEEPAHRGAKQLYDYWQTCEAKGGLTIGRDLPSKAISRILGDTFVLQPTDGDYIVRIVGNNMRRRFGRDASRKRLSELLDKEEFSYQFHGIEEIRLSGVPASHRIVMTSIARQITRESLVVPAQSPDRTQRWIIVAVFYDE